MVRSPCDAFGDSNCCDIREVALFASTCFAYLYLSKRKQRVAVPATKPAATVNVPVEAVKSTICSSTLTSRSLVSTNGYQNAPLAKNQKQEKTQQRDKEQAKENPSQHLATVNSQGDASSSTTSTSPSLVVSDGLENVSVTKLSDHHQASPNPSLVVSNGHENASATKHHRQQQASSLVVPKGLEKAPATKQQNVSQNLSLVMSKGLEKANATKQQNQQHASPNSFLVVSKGLEKAPATKQPDQQHASPNSFLVVPKGLEKDPGMKQPDQQPSPPNSSPVVSKGLKNARTTERQDQQQASPKSYLAVPKGLENARAIKGQLDQQANPNPCLAASKGLENASATTQQDQQQASPNQSLVVSTGHAPATEQQRQQQASPNPSLAVSNGHKDEAPNPPLVTFNMRRNSPLLMKKLQHQKLSSPNPYLVVSNGCNNAPAPKQQDQKQVSPNSYLMAYVKHENVPPMEQPHHQAASPKSYLIARKTYENVPPMEQPHQQEESHKSFHFARKKFENASTTKQQHVHHKSFLNSRKKHENAPTTKQQQMQQASPSPSLLVSNGRNDALATKQSNTQQASPIYTGCKNLPATKQQDQQQASSNPSLVVSEELENAPVTKQQDQQQASSHPSLVVSEELENAPATKQQVQQQASSNPSLVVSEELENAPVTKQQDEHQASSNPSLVVSKELESAPVTTQQDQQQASSNPPLASKELDNAPATKQQDQQPESPNPSLAVSNGSKESAPATPPPQQHAEKEEKLHQNLLQSLQVRTSLNENEQVLLVTGDTNEPLSKPGKRSEMRLDNLWHRATYILIKHEASHIEQHGDHPADVHLLIQRRSMNKDYCPGKLDPAPGGVVGYQESNLENAVRELQEEMGIVIPPDCIVDSPPPLLPHTATASALIGDTKTNTTTTTTTNRLVRLFTFPYEDEHVRVWGDFYECTYTGALKDLVVQKEQGADVIRMSLEELKDRVQQTPQDFMPDAAHAILLYFQRRSDLQANRRMLKGYSFHNLDAYNLHPKPAAIFFDCDNCLYFDNWKTAKQFTHKIDEWCVKNGLVPGQAYELYKQYGTALRGLLAEGYLEDTEEAIDGFLQYVHDIPIAELIQPDELLRQILKQIDPSIPKYIFTASVADHARRCIQALGIEDLFVGIIDCKTCGLESKHSHHSFEVAMKVAGITDPEQCLFFDDNLANIRAARNAGWRCVLVGRIGRHCGQPVSSEHAELEIDRIHDMAVVLPELFGAGNWRSNVLPMDNDLN